MWVLPAISAMFCARPRFPPISNAASSARPCGEVLARMQELYFTSANFDRPVIAGRRVVDELAMALSVFDCIMPNDAGIYCSTPLTTCKSYYTPAALAAQG